MPPPGLHSLILYDNPKPDMPSSFSRNFSDLPMEVLDEIVSNLSAKERLGIRKVCRNLRDVIDQHKPYMKIFRLFFEKRSNISKIDDVDLKFSKKFYEKALKPLGNFVKTSSHAQDTSIARLKVEKAEISAINTGEALEILGFFEPGELKKIELLLESGDGNVTNLVEMELFKLAESVDIRNFGIFDSELLEKFLHLKDCSVKVNSISKEDALRLKNAILEDSGPQVLRVSLKLEEYDLDEILDHLEIDEESGDVDFNSAYFTEEIRLEFHLTEIMFSRHYLNNLFII